MYPMRVTRRRSLGDWWPFPVPGTAPPMDPLSCMMRYPEYTWNASTNQCISTADPNSAGATAYWYMEQACNQLPSCRWDYTKKTCACSNTSSIAPKSDGVASTCPAGSMAIPAGLPGAGTCFPTSGANIPAWPWAPPGSPTPVNPNVPVPPEPTPKETQPSWWSQQTDMTKALVIGGGAVAALGLVLLLTSGKGKGPAIVYTSGVPRAMTANKMGEKSRRRRFFLASGKEISKEEYRDALEDGSYVYTYGNIRFGGPTGWQAYHLSPIAWRIGSGPSFRQTRLASRDVPKKVLAAAGQ
jgi:hypothetical protein